MLHRYWMWGAILATGSLLVAGCGPAPGANRHPQTEHAAVSRRHERADEAAVERAAEAHAHYAAGVVREMNDEQQAATEEYYQAAHAGPG